MVWTLRQVPEATWQDYLIRSLKEVNIEGVEFPTWPDEDFQKRLHGHSSEASITEALSFLNAVKTTAARFGVTIDQETKLLDFGSGWGRIARVFMNDAAPKNIYGVEPCSEFVRVARKHNIYLNFIESDYQPPLPFRDGAFDVVVCWSVFSHLDKDMAERWISEFSRLLRPGGIAFATTHARWFLEICSKLRNKLETNQELTAWQRVIAQKFVNEEELAARWDAGEFLHAATNTKHPHYGDTLIPEAYARNRWGKYLELVDYIHDRGILPQALMVFRKGDGAG